MFYQLTLCIISVWILKFSHGDTLPHTGRTRRSVVNHDKCEEITTPMCTVFYNQTIMPNIFRHKSATEALRALDHFKSGISPTKSIDFLLCSLFLPVCTVLEEFVPPCRGICLRAKRRLENPELWPSFIECEHLPSSGLCVGANRFRK